MTTDFVCQLLPCYYAGYSFLSYLEQVSSKSYPPIYLFFYYTCREVQATGIFVNVLIPQLTHGMVHLMWFFVSLLLKLCVIGSSSNIFFLTFSPFFIQLVFAVFNGEAWGYLGSRKFLQELDEGAASVNGISSLMIDQVSARQVNTGSGSLRLLLIIFHFSNIYKGFVFSTFFGLVS